MLGALQTGQAAVLPALSCGCIPSMRSPLLQDWSLGASQLHLMGSGLLCLLSPSHVPPTTALATWPLLLGALRHTAQRAVRSGCYDVTAVAPHQQLAWLLEAGNQQAAGAGSAAAKWQQLLRQSLAHEAWSGFLQGVWTGASGLLPDPHASSMSEYRTPAACWPSPTACSSSLTQLQAAHRATHFLAP